MERRWISVKECAEYLNLHEKSIYRLLGTEIPYSKIGRSVRIDLKKLQLLLERREEELGG